MRQSPFNSDHVIDLDYRMNKEAVLKYLRKRKITVVSIIVLATTCFAFGVISMALADSYLGIFLSALVCGMNAYYAQYYVRELRAINVEIVSANSIWI